MGDKLYSLAGATANTEIFGDEILSSLRGVQVGSFDVTLAVAGAQYFYALHLRQIGAHHTHTLRPQSNTTFGLL